MQQLNGLILKHNEATITKHQIASDRNLKKAQNNKESNVDEHTQRLLFISRTELENWLETVRGQDGKATGGTLTH